MCRTFSRNSAVFSEKGVEFYNSTPFYLKDQCGERQEWSCFLIPLVTLLRYFDMIGLDFFSEKYFCF